MGYSYGVEAQSASRQYPLRLWYQQPAVQWTQALPVGNGRLGGMIYGGVPTEQIQFNEETLWTGKPQDSSHKGAHQYLPQIRQLLAAGKQKEADSLALLHFMGNPLRQMAYQAFGDLYLDFPGHSTYSKYQRELDIEKALATVSYEVNGVTYRREVLSSNPDQTIAIRLTASKAKALNFTARFDALHDQKSVEAKGNELRLNVKVKDGALEAVARVKVLTDGKVTQENGVLRIRNASQATLFLTAATNYLRYDNISGNPAALSEASLKKVSDYEKVKKAHTQDYQQLYNRFAIQLPGSTTAEVPTDQRLIQFKSTKNDPGLLALYVQYARYLLIASSRPGTQPANLQGIWNESLTPPWDSKWTVNINTEMNYWPAELTGLPECHEPLFAMIKDVSETGQKVAREHYNLDGWVLHHNTDIWRGAAPINAADHGIWVSGGAWLSLHLWQHYLFTQDKEFLQKTGYPLMKGAAQFFTNFLTEDPKTGWLISTPSNSPENGGLVAGPTMDHQIIRELFRACVEAAGVLQTDAAFATKLKTLVPRIAPNQIGRYGQLQEWLTDLDDPKNKHRHVSHLWGLYPGNEINPVQTPDLFKAAQKSLEFRGDDGTGWSLAWKINFWARFLDGDHAYRMITLLLNPVFDSDKKNTGGGSYANLFDAHPPFQIDGNFGGAAGILELLVQSHLDEVNLLPALPAALPSGTVSGLVARGGFVLDLDWKDNKLQAVRVVSKAGKPCTLRYKDKTVTFPTETGKTYRFNGELVILN
ncbi:glycoside hydrolase family 95 protein [Telluribacter sp.]|uniref:glycoside hydrolase family 95 protein n=1 Tax=Telluribacter sp. TaxID=1978767 RepID=UPI002E13CA6A